MYPHGAGDPTGGRIRNVASTLSSQCCVGSQNNCTAGLVYPVCVLKAHIPAEWAFHLKTNSFIFVFRQNYFLIFFQICVSCTVQNASMRHCQGSWKGLPGHWRKGRLSPVIRMQGDPKVGIVDSNPNASKAGNTSSFCASSKATEGLYFLPLTNFQ